MGTERDILQLKSELADALCWTNVVLQHFKIISNIFGISLL